MVDPAGAETEVPTPAILPSCTSTLAPGMRCPFPTTTVPLWMKNVPSVPTKDCAESAGANAKAANAGTHANTVAARPLMEPLKEPLMDLLIGRHPS